MDANGTEKAKRTPHERLAVPTADPASRRRQVCASLSALPGIVRAADAGDRYEIDYDLRALGAAEVLESLGAAGGGTGGGLLATLRLQLRCYRDGVRRDEQLNESGWDSFVREIYVSRYRHRRHGRRDDRPRNWRHYGERDPR